MSAVRYGSWRFNFPGPGESGGPAGICVSARGAIAMVTEAASVRQAILLLLGTRVGERIMRPEYGCELSKLLFAPNDDTTAGLAIHYVRQALTRWEPRIEQLRLDAVRRADQPSRLDLVLDYRLRMNGQADQTSVTLDLHAQGAA